MKFGIEYYTEDYVDVFEQGEDEQKACDALKEAALHYINLYEEDGYVVTENEIDEHGLCARLEFEREKDGDYFYINLELVYHNGTDWIGLDERPI